MDIERVYFERRRPNLFHAGMKGAQGAQVLLFRYSRELETGAWAKPQVALSEARIHLGSDQHG